MKAIVLSLMVMLSLAGCQKEEDAVTGTGLVGKWEWVSTTGGILGVHQTPQKLGYTYWIAYTQDSLYNVYDKNNLLVASNPFTLIKANSIFDNKEHVMIQSYSMRTSFEVRHDSLFLFEEVSDGFNNVFVRR
jgi:hypothetical protein